MLSLSRKSVRLNAIIIKKICTFHCYHYQENLYSFFDEGPKVAKPFQFDLFNGLWGKQSVHLQQWCQLTKRRSQRVLDSYLSSARTTDLEPNEDGYR